MSAVFSLHDPEGVRGLIEAAGFTDVQARSESKSLRVPREDFLWQYVYSTPLAEAARGLDENRRAVLQQEVVTGWEPFADDGGLILEADVTSATGRRA